MKYKDCQPAFTGLKLVEIRMNEKCLQKVLNYMKCNEVLKAQNYTSQVA